MKIRLVQCSPQVGNIEANVQLIIQHLALAQRDGINLLLFPELVLTGYPPEDLLMQSDMISRVENAIGRIALAAQDVAIMFGHPRKTPTGLYNSLSVYSHGQCIFSYDKQHLPNYGVFDERRYFLRGNAEQKPIFCLHGQQFGVAICEDLWSHEFADAMVDYPVDLWLSINASPYHMTKRREREGLCHQLAQHCQRPIAYLNMVGGQDELVFDGGSFVCHQQGLLHALSGFEEDILDFYSRDLETVNPLTLAYDEMAELHQVLLTGLRDYVTRNGASQVVLGLSGGIDSAVVAALASEALGADAVLGILLPSEFSSEHSINDALHSVELLGLEHRLISIASLVEQGNLVLAPHFEALGYQPEHGVCEENIQARARGLLLMAISNKSGRMLLTTGNKSEMAVGYATLYGDMCGAFAVLKDVYKTRVFALANWMNRRSMQLHGRLCIPQNSIDKPPSAELAPDQQDSDSLPDYEDLDRMLDALIEKHASVEDIVRQYGFAGEEVRRVENLLHQSEYKRRQAPPGVKVTACSFGRERRFPMTHGYRSAADD